MARSGHQIQMDRTEKGSTDRDVVFNPPGQALDRAGKGASHMASQIKLEHNTLTDIAFVDVNDVQPGDCVEVLDIGETLDFPGQIQVRINREKEIVYGLTIQNYSGFRRRLKIRYGVWSFRRAIQLLISILLAGLRIDQETQHSHGHAALPC